MFLIKPEKKTAHIFGKCSRHLAKQDFVTKKTEFWLDTYLIVPSTSPLNLIVQSIKNSFSLKITSGD